MLNSNYRRHISRGLVVLLILLALQAAFAQPAAHASDTNIHELKVTPNNSRITGATPFRYTFDFEAMDDIVAYTTEIIISFPPEVLDNAAQEGNALTLQNSNNISDYVIDKGLGTITFTSTMNISSLTPVNITLADTMGLKNPSTAGYASFSINIADQIYTNEFVYFHTSGGDMLENVNIQEDVAEGTNYLELNFTNHLDLPAFSNVQISFPYGIDVNAFDLTNVSIRIGVGTIVPTNADLQNSTLRISTPERIRPDTSSTIMIPIKENMNLASGSYNVDVRSSNEMSPSIAQLVIEEKQVQSLMIVSAPAQAGVVSALTINFVTNRQLIADESSIIVEFPSEVTLPDEVTPGEITINGVAVEGVDKDDQALILTVPSSVNMASNVMIVFSQSFGIINPTSPGEYDFNVKVEGDNNVFKLFTTTYTQAPTGGSEGGSGEGSEGGPGDPGGGSTAPPTITNVRLVDYDGVPGEITGFIAWNGPDDQTGIDSYSIFFIDSSGGIVSEISNIPVDSERYYSLNIGNISIPTNAARIGVRWNYLDSHGEMVTGSLWDHPDNYPFEVRYEDTDLTAGVINGVLTWNKPPSESGISYYRISYNPTDYEDVQIGDLIPANGSAIYTYAIPSEIATNQEVLYLNMVDEHGQMGGSQNVVTMMDYTSGSTIPLSPVRADLSAPKDIFYYDDNNEIGNYAGYVYWNNPEEASNITSYQLSYVMSNGTTQAFAQVKKKSEGRYKIYLSSISNGPSGVITDVQAISIRSMDSEDNVSTPIIADIVDRAPGSYVAYDIQFYDFDMTVGELAGTISWSHPQAVSLISGYVIYFIDDEHRRISKIGAVTISENRFIIPPNTLIPAGANGVAIFSKGNVLLSNHQMVDIDDSGEYTNYIPSFRSTLTSMMDVNNNGLEIDDVVKYMATQYDLSGDNTFNADDVRWMLNLFIPLPPG